MSKEREQFIIPDPQKEPKRYEIYQDSLEQQAQQSWLDRHSTEKILAFQEKHEKDLTEKAKEYIGFALKQAEEQKNK